MKESELQVYALQALIYARLVHWRVTNSATPHHVSGKLIFKKSAIKGFPDIAGIFPDGKFFAIELKTQTGRLTKEQKEWITKINMTGGMAVVLRSKHEVDEFIKAATARKPA